jgi:hypothetical protein
MSGMTAQTSRMGESHRFRRLDALSTRTEYESDSTLSQFELELSDTGRAGCEIQENRNTMWVVR